jgi:hypothetical protein
MTIAEPSPPKFGPAPKSLSPERFAEYLAMLEACGSHILASHHVRMDPDRVLQCIRDNRQWADQAKRTRAVYSAKVVSAIEQQCAAGVPLSEAALAVLRAHCPNRYPSGPGGSGSQGTEGM